MLIALTELFPVTEELLKRTLEKAPYYKKLLFVRSGTDNDGLFDLTVFDESRTGAEFRGKSRAELFDSSHPASKGRFSFPCGMKMTDTVTLSSIGEDSAMLCLQNEIRLFSKDISPFEKKIPFDRNYSIYKNIVAGFVPVLCDAFFGEEKWNKTESRSLI